MFSPIQHVVRVAQRLRQVNLSVQVFSSRDMLYKQSRGFEPSSSCAGEPAEGSPSAHKAASGLGGAYMCLSGRQPS